MIQSGSEAFDRDGVRTRAASHIIPNSNNPGPRPRYHAAMTNPAITSNDRLI
jgi:hypothetical protein